MIEPYRESLPYDRRKLLDGYRFVHLARKVVGVGSVGTRAWVALFVGRDEDDPLFLQIKEADRSVLEPYTSAAVFDHQGQRVVEGQRVTQSTSDILLGWLSAVGPDGNERDFYVRQLWDEKGSFDISTMSPYAMSLYAQLCGGSSRALTPAPATRSRSPATSAAATASTVRWPHSPTAYADQNQRDYEALQAAVEDGRLAVEQEAD